MKNLSSKSLFVLKSMVVKRLTEVIEIDKEIKRQIQYCKDNMPKEILNVKKNVNWSD